MKSEQNSDPCARNSTSATAILKRIPHGRHATIFHLGTKKTGTTYIQSLAKNNLDLLFKQGILYPSGFPEIAFAHHSIPRELSQRSPAENSSLEYYRRLALERTHVLISAEDLIYLEESRLRALLDLHPNRPCFAVVYFRSLPGYLRSLIQEDIKHGWTGPFDSSKYAQRIKSIIDNPKSMNTSDYEAMASRVVNVFGSDRSIFVSYDNARDEETDFFLYFLEKVIGVQISNLDIAKPFQNEHMGFHKQEINRLFNFMIKWRGINSGTWAFEYVIRNSSRIKEHVLELNRLNLYRNSLKIDSKFELLSQIERQFYRNFGNFFINIPSCNPENKEAKTVEIEWADLDLFSKNHPSALKILGPFVDECIKKFSPHAKNKK